MYPPLENGIVIVHVSDHHINTVLENNSFPWLLKQYTGHDFLLVRGLLRHHLRKARGAPHGHSAAIRSAEESGQHQRLRLFRKCS